ncbi:serine/threonine protein kinase [candidate division KSB1 bacterium]|nr:serine/threonine protein kinase [candidate division KSB1 bacterium]RQW06871.1 MAG: serine/threonine protein kinase [candidate division KSB1 bacterium]
MVGMTISHYKILELIGQAGMGEVYKAEDIALKRFVALKFLSPELTIDPQAVERFIREAQTASALDHQNICTIHEISQSDDGQYFIIMAYYEGETLRHKISAGPVDIEEALDITQQPCRGLEKAHAKSIMHLDLKPENIIITPEGDVKILDFGVGELVSRQGAQRSTSGTLAYMSPEQLMGKAIDFRTDIWAVGVILYEMLDGQRPFRGDFAEEMIYSILNEEPESINEQEHPLEKTITKLLQKEVHKRYQKMADVLSDLRILADEEQEHLLTLS